MCKFLTQLLVNIHRHLAPAPAPVHRHLATGEAVCEAGKMSLSICFWGCETTPLTHEFFSEDATVQVKA